MYSQHSSYSALTGDNTFQTYDSDNVAYGRTHVRVLQYHISMTIIIVRISCNSSNQRIMHTQKCSATKRYRTIASFPGPCFIRLHEHKCIRNRIKRGPGNEASKNIITKTKSQCYNLWPHHFDTSKQSGARFACSCREGMGMRLLNLGSSIKYKHQNKKTKVKLGLDMTHVARAKCSVCKEAVERGSGYPRLQLSCSITYLKYGQ